VQGVTYSYPESEWELHETDLAVQHGEIVGIIGPNGSGKSTLLRIAAGIIKPRGGRVLLNDKDLARQSRREIARSLGYLPQGVTSEFDYTVEEIVAMGRFPHVEGAGYLQQRDITVIEKALEATEMLEYRERHVSRLSGGERQRVFLASILAQEPEGLLLDEPTSALDIHHQVAFFKLLAELAGRGIGVAVVTHDLNLAAAFCTRLVLMAGGRITCEGDATQVIREDTLRRTYGEDLYVHSHPQTSGPIVLPRIGDEGRKQCGDS